MNRGSEEFIYMKKLLAGMLVVMAVASGRGQTVTNSPKPLLRAHAHNDYEHKHPLFDALEQGRAMALNPPPPLEPPPGPTKARSRRRAFMLSHNNRVEGRRKKRKAQEGRG